MKVIYILATICMMASLSLADTPRVTTASASKSGDTWRFNVTLLHKDEGWDHYADGWTILSETGEVLGHRVLAHPHVYEQPFTRSLGGIALPEGTSKVIIRPHDLVHGDGPDFVLKLK